MSMKYIKSEDTKIYDKSSNTKSDFHRGKPASDNMSVDDKSNINKMKHHKFDSNLKLKKKKHTKKENVQEKYESEKVKPNLNPAQSSEESGNSWKKKEKKIKSLKHENNVDAAEDTETQKSKKKSFKRKCGDLEDASTENKIKPCEMKFKKRKIMRQTIKHGEKYDVVKNLKLLWEELRRDDVEPERKRHLLKQVCCVLEGRVKEFAFAHDSVRILECVLAEGTEEHRTLLFEELKDDILTLSKSKYGKFFVLKMLKYGAKKHKDAIMNAFDGHVTKLVKHTEAAEVVEMAFNECANAPQRCQMVQEFYGSSYRHFKEANIHNLAELLEKKPEAKNSIIKSMKEELSKVLGKSVVKHSLVHHVLLQFFLNCDPASRSEIIESLREVVPEILHTKDGSRVAMHCVWHGNHKDRKIIVKHMKTFVKKIAMEEHGHMVLLALFDCVDDTALIEKYIIKELQESLLEVSSNVHGKKVLVYLLNPRDPHFFHPDIINILKVGDNNEFSKKNPELRSMELQCAIAKPLTDFIVTNIANLYKDNAFCLFTVTILKHTVGDRQEAFESIARLAVEPYTSENKNVHFIENNGSNFMLKKLILNDVHKEKSNTVTFSEVLVNTIPAGVLKTWFHCNRGAFLLVNLLETKIPVVVNKVKEELTGCKKQIKKFTFKGAELLLEKLKQAL